MSTDETPNTHPLQLPHDLDRHHPTRIHRVLSQTASRRPPHLSQTEAILVRTCMRLLRDLQHAENQARHPSAHHLARLMQHR